MNSSTLAGIAIVLGIVQGCGGEVASPPESGDRVTPPSETSERQPGVLDSGVPVTAPHTMGAPPDLAQCPAQEPELDTECAAEGIVCTYGDAVRVDCRHARRCEAGTWVIDDQVEDCHLQPKGYCPAAIPDGACIPTAWDGQRIDGSGQVVCDYAGGTTCVCNRCSVEDCGGPMWVCAPPPTKPECPAKAPNLGQPCATSGVACEYGFACEGGGKFVCKDGTWYPLPTACF